jgi:hypothetical protein
MAGVVIVFAAAADDHRHGAGEGKRQDLSGVSHVRVRCSRGDREFKATGGRSSPSGTDPGPKVGRIPPGLETFRHPGFAPARRTFSFRRVNGSEFIRDLAVVTLVAGAAGWLCRRLGLSAVVGYLAAGIVIGPYTPPFQLVASKERVEMLAEFGLVFLIFSVGLGLSLGRLNRLGLSVALGTAISALLVLNLCRLFGATLGWSSTESLFLAGMLMVSSSAIIAKVLDELGALH